MNDLISMMAAWAEAKAAEKAAQERRREIEDQVLAELKIGEGHTGTRTVELPGAKLKIVGRISTSVDYQRLRELSHAAGLDEHLDRLFSWKAEVRAKAWKDADSTITGALAGAITEKPGRPSFSIEEA